MTSWLQKGPAVSNKRKNTDDKDINNKEDKNISKIRKEN